MVRYLTTNGKSNTYGLSHPFALRYRRVNGTFYETINIRCCDLSASTGLVGKKCKSPFNGDPGFFNLRILAYFSDRVKRKGSPLRSPLAKSDISQVFEVDDILWVRVDISGKRQGENAGTFTMIP
jgi:hypothetical protein